jgi:predicted nucleotidyltransferase component of viral defense system
MKAIYSTLQLREVFHLEFLRWLGRKIRPNCYALKGGANLRFFFKSFRYSEDVDLDVRGIKRDVLKEAVMHILNATSFHDNLRPFGVERIIPPDITKAKQTETTQRFKAHIMTYAGEDLFSKIEFSRRGFTGEVIVQPVDEIILRTYELAPLVIPHYGIGGAIMQKIHALSTRTIVQPRDIFDLYTLSSQFDPVKTKEVKLADAMIAKVCENILEIDFIQFRDTVISYLSHEDRAMYNSEAVWDELKLKVSSFIEGLGEAREK